ncbi:MAG TPA: glycosyltransferase [Pantanalinema sp.]
MSSRAILITPHSGHEGLIQALRDRGHHVVVFGAPTFTQYMAAARTQLQPALQAQAAGWDETFQGIFPARSFHLSGRDWTPQVADRLGPLVLQNTLNFQVIARAFALLHRDHPLGAVVVHNDVAPNLRLLVAEAERHAIATLHLPHGLSLAPFPLGDFHDLIRTTWVGAEGAYTRDTFLLNAKNQPQQIALLGRPAWDELYRQSLPERAAACARLGLAPERLVVGFSGSWPHTLTTFDLPGLLEEGFREFLRGVLLFADAQPQIVVRPHPGHRALGDFGPAWHQRLADEVGIAISVPDAPRDWFLGACDLVVGLDSTFQTEALLAGKHGLSIAWQQPGTGTRSGYAPYPGVATCPPAADAIAEALRACLMDEGFRASLEACRAQTAEHFNYRNDGHATERTVAFIERMMEEGTRMTPRVPEGGYYGRINQRLATMVPPGAKRILEVGCAAGYLGAWLKEQNPTREVVGFEAFPEAALEARMRLDAVVEGDVETLDLPYPEGYFDCILYGDVLEHLRDPGAVLAKHRRHLAPGGEVLVCLPNVAHWSVIGELLSGAFTYADEGLLDRTHLRFFTQQSFAQLLAQSGLRVLEASTIDVPHPLAGEVLTQAASALGIDNPSLAAQSNAYQLLFRATHTQAQALPPAATIELPDRRGFNIVVPVGDPEQLPMMIEAYLKAFAQDDDVALHLLAGARLDAVQATVVQTLETSGHSPEAIPDICLLDVPAAPEGLTAYLRAGDLVMAEPRLARVARDMGLPALSRPEPETLRAAVSAIGDTPWAERPLPMTEKHRERWLATCGDDWQQPLEAFLAAVNPDQEVALLLRVAPGTAEANQDRIATWLQAKGHDIEAIPDVILLDAPATSEMAIFRLATAWLDDGTAVSRARAEALDLRILPPTPAALSKAAGTPVIPGSCSLVVVSYNSQRTLDDCLTHALRTMAPDDELIVVDNASQDGTAGWLQAQAERDPRLRIVLSPSNLGFSAGSNAGLRIGKGEFSILLNPDTVVTPGWLERLRSRCEDPAVGAVGPTSDYVAGLQKIQRYLPPALPSAITPETLAMILAGVNLDGTVETKLLIGFCMMIPRRVLDRVGLLDEELFLGNDDLDLSWRLRDAGYRLVVAADAFVHHVGQVSFKTEPSDRTKRLVQESTDALARKLVRHYGPGRVPSADDLWGMSWFDPTPGILEGEAAQPVASIVVLTYNQLEVTRLCVESLFRHTRDFELIVVDNASADGTVGYLQHLAAQHPNVKLLLNDRNRGFAGGCNQGIAVAQGRHVVLLNNDTVVSEGWLDGMIAAAEAPGIGLVGPRTNCITGPQQVDGVGYDQRSLAGFEAYASDWRRRHGGEVLSIQRIIGFCMLIRREVIERLGGLDMRFGRGNFEDDDYCLRAQVAGFGIALANDVFIHHFGSVTFKGQKIDYRQAMEENWGKFKRKWLLPEAQPMERGYSLSDALALPFDPRIHTEPVFSPEAAPTDLPDRAAFNVVLAAPDEALLAATLEAYLEAFAPGAETCLHVLTGPEGTAVQEEVVAQLARLNLDPANIPDISLLEAPVIPLELPRYLAAADLVLGPADVAQGARDMGRPAFEAPTAELLRVARERFKALNWNEEAPLLEARAKERWLCATDWKEGLAAFLAAESEPHRSLLVPVKPGKAEGTLEAIAEWLSVRGLDPEAIPDVLLLEQVGTSGVGLVRAATVWVDSQDLVARAIALALGLRVASPAGIRQDPPAPARKDA